MFSETSAVILSSCNHTEPFEGPIIPFEQRLSVTRFQYEVSLDFNALIAGGFWKGDILIADIEELEIMDASEIYPRRINAK